MSSCIIDGKTTNQFTLENKSGVEIKILPTDFMIDTLFMKVNEKQTTNARSGKGKSDGITYAGFADFRNPVIVIFQNKDTIKHFNDTLNHLGNYYNLKSNRCFYNKESYTKEIKSVSKHSNDVVLNYTFTEQDYLDAQK